MTSTQSPVPELLSATLRNETPKRARRLWWILCGGGILVAATSVLGVYVTQYASRVNADLSPLPRIPINAPFIKTPDIVVDKMVELGEVTAADLVYDLGCGDGRLVIGAAVQRGCRGIGFDIEAERIAEATTNAEQQNVQQLVSFQQKDIFQVDLKDADVILVYLLPWMLEKLTTQFENCKPGTRIVSHDFVIEGYAIDKTITLPVGEDGEHYIYLYVTPLKK